MKNSQNYQFKNYLIHQFDEIESTNDSAFSLVENKQIFANHIIVANKQNKGRGRLNRNWESPIGNLYFSLTLQPKIAIEKTSQISFVAVCALQIAVEKIFQQQNIVVKIQNKWPNDLLIEQKKVAGILLESKISNENCEFVICHDSTATNFAFLFYKPIITIIDNELINSRYNHSRAINFFCKRAKLKKYNISNNNMNKIKITLNKKNYKIFIRNYISNNSLNDTRANIILNNIEFKS